ncbi:hypothetical protein [Microbacterium sp. 1S1]|uniref:hypothetical protein n=1 Tax=Microbacterium sp. 1S1 TaxID=2606451 RepID=UPI00397511E8
MSLSKLSSWFLLMIISVVLVAWVYPPQVPSALLDDEGRPTEDRADAPRKTTARIRRR